MLMKEVDLGEPTSFLEPVYLGCTQRECQISKDIVDNYKSMFESRISAGAVGKLSETRAPGKPDANTISSWSYDMEGRAKKCVEGYCELAKKQLSNKIKSRRGAWMIINSKKKMDQLENCPRFTYCSEMSIFGTYWETWYSMVCEQTCSCCHKMDKSLWQTFATFDLIHSSHVNTGNIVMWKTQHNIAD